MPNYHVPVLMDSVMKYLKVKPGGRYIDATIGDGGHTKEIIRRGGLVLGIDRDPGAVSLARRRLGLEIADGRLFLSCSNFDRIEKAAAGCGFGRIEGAFFDLGVSSRQLGDFGRGFSFSGDGPLDMRMDPRLGVTAADLVNVLKEKELKRVFSRLGGEKKSGLIARKIVEARKKRKFETTGQLAKLVGEISPRRGRLHPATKVFMALRMVVNDELDSISRALPAAVNLLLPGGRLVVISFHEGEDRIVKTLMRSNPDLNPITKKIVRPLTEEVRLNPRSASARLRAAERKT